MKNFNKIYILWVCCFLHLSTFSQTTLVSPTDDINDGTDYCDPVYIDASNQVSTTGGDVEFSSEPAGFVLLTDGFTATATASNFFLAGIVNLCLVSTDEAADLVSKINTYPNPFTDYVEFELVLQKAANVDIRLYDQTGKLFKILMTNERMTEGSQTVTFETADFPTGIYFYELQVDGHRQGGKLTCVR